MINFQPFQMLYSQLKGTDIRLYEAMDRISGYLQQLVNASNISESNNIGANTNSFPNILSADIMGGAFALTTVFNYVPGAFLLLNKSGPWIVIGIFDFINDTAGGACLGQLEFNGLPVVPNPFAVLDNSVGTVRSAVPMCWTVQNSGNSYVKLMTAKSVNAGASFISVGTRLIALFTG